MTPCKEWDRARNPKGYGVTKAKHGTRLVHRIVWIDAHGPVPPGQRVLHTCDNPPCYEMSHLYAGTPAQNTADMMERGRQVAPTNEHNGRHTISNETVMAMRLASAQGRSYKAIAREHGVHPVTVSRICRGLRRP